MHFYPISPLWLLSRKLPHCTKGENKPPLSPLTRASIYADMRKSPFACRLRVQGSEMKKQSRSNQHSLLHNSTHTIALLTKPLNQCRSWLIILIKLSFDHILRNFVDVFNTACISSVTHKHPCAPHGGADAFVLMARIHPSSCLSSKMGLT